jgi:hypothetical protein
MGKLNLKLNKTVLAKGKEAFANGDDFNNAELEPGRYNGWVKSMRSITTTSGQQLVIDVEVPEANEGKGGKVGLFYSLDNEERIVWLYRVLATLGYDVTDGITSDLLEEIASDLAANNPVVRIKARRGGEYINYSIEKLMEGQTKDDISTGGDTGGSAADETNADGAKGMSDKAPAGAKAKKAVKKAVVEEEAPPAEEEVVEEVAEETVEEEAVEVKPGLKCKATIQGVLVDIEVVQVLEDEGKVVVLNKKDKKKYKISGEKLSLE